MFREITYTSLIPGITQSESFWTFAWDAPSRERLIEAQKKRIAEKFAGIVPRHCDGATIVQVRSSAAVLRRGPHSLAARIHACGHASTRVSARAATVIGRSERGRCTERMHDEAPQSTATLRDRRFVLQRVTRRVRAERVHLPVSECLSSVSSAQRVSSSRDTFHLTRFRGARVCATLRCVRIAEGGPRGCVVPTRGTGAFGSPSPSFTYPYECELLCVTTEFEESPRHWETLNCRDRI